MVLVGLAITSALDLAAVPSSLAFARTSAPGIENRRWRIAKYRGDDTQKGDEQGLVNAAKTAEITFSKGRIRGSKTCGGLVGTYTLAGDRLTVQAPTHLRKGPKIYRQLRFQRVLSRVATSQLGLNIAQPTMKTPKRMANGPNMRPPNQFV